jgi:hypothetical protein
MKAIGVLRQNLDQLLRLIGTEQQGRHVIISRHALRDFHDKTSLIAGQTPDADLATVCQWHERLPSIHFPFPLL